MSLQNLFVLTETNLLRMLITTLRDRQTESQEFARAANLVGRLLAAQALEFERLSERRVVTPLEATDGACFFGSSALVPILRAGEALVALFRELLLRHPHVWHLGLSRDHETLQSREYLCRVPEAVSDFTRCYVLDPMLATGGSAEHAVRLLKKRGAHHIAFVGVVGAPEGVRFLFERHPDVRVYLAALDRELDSRGYILPGLGDFGDRYFGSDYVAM
jgi:uracil phosphoribosyltransferase